MHSILLALTLTLGAPFASAQAPLHARALDLVERARPLDAFELVCDELPARVHAGFDTPRAIAEAEADTLVLGDVVRRLQNEPVLVTRLAPHRPWPADAPPTLVHRLEFEYASALRACGRVDEARAIVDRAGAFTDWLLLGPFDNERGSGMQRPGPAEERIDLDAEVAGKERPVRWRTNPGAAHPLGRIVLHELFRPRAQVYAYLATTLEVDAAADVELRLASTSALRVFLNGVELFGHDRERDLGVDQDVVLLPLAAGRNQLVVKSGVEEGDWVLHTRFTAVGGAPFVARPVTERVEGGAVDGAEETVAAEREGGPIVDAAAAPRARAVEFALGAGATRLRSDPSLLEREHAVARATERAAASGPAALFAALPDDADAQRSLAHWHLSAHELERTSRAAEEAARRANELEPDDVGGAFQLARALYPRGQSRAEMALEPYRLALAQVLELDPEHVGAELAMARLATEFLPLPERADEWTRRALAHAPDARATLEWRASYLRGRGRETEAIELEKRGLALPEARWQGAAIVDRARAELARGHADAGLERLLESLEARPHIGAVLDEAIAWLSDRGEVERIFALAERGLAGATFSVGSMLEYARRLEAAALDDEFALRPEFAGLVSHFVERALEISPEHVPAHRMAARLAFRRGEEAAALDALNEALRFDPGNDRLRRQIALASRVGDEARFEDPWRRDGAVHASLPLPTEGGNHPIEMLEKTVVHRVYADGGHSAYRHLVLRPLNVAGLEALDSWPIVYPVGGHLFVHAVQVHRADGPTERVPAPRRRDARRGGYAARVFDLPPLEIGDLVDVEYRVDELEPGVFGEYFGTRHDFGPDRIDSLAPTRYSELAVLSPPELPIFAEVRRGDALEASADVDEAGVRVQRWIARDLGRLPLESDMPSSSELVPIVEVSTYPDWESFGEWWWNFIQKEFDTSPAMRAKVAELCEGLETEAERVQAIYRFVAQEIRYNAWAFGTHGYEPFRASTIFERRFGDCKDKSILLRQMLAEIDVDAVPVLIHTYVRMPEQRLERAMVEHFNHCIAYVTPTDERDGYYLDATADRNPIEYLRYDDQGATVLHVSEGGARLHEIPYAPPDENALRREWVVELHADGRADVRMRDDSNGKYGVGMRYRYGGETGDLAKKLAAELNAAFGEVEVQSVRSSELDDTTSAAWLESEFTARDVWTTRGDERTLPLFFDPLGLRSSAVEPPDERRYDVVLERPLRHHSRILYRLPEGAETLRLPPPIEVDAEGLLYYRMSIEAVDEGLLVEREFELRSRRIATDDYAAFRDALQSIRVAEERTIGLRLANEEEGR